jgi:parallel beta-helix repeat protein
MVKKTIILIISLFLTSTLITPLGAIKIENQLSTSVFNDILYVGGSGPGNYTKIQAAINDALPGDTIYVYDDSSPYPENLIITTPLYLTGEHKDTTIIQGRTTNYTIQVLINDVVIQCFTITHDYDLEDDYLVTLYINSNDNSIIDNIFPSKPFRRERTILLYNSSYNQLSNNQIQQNYDTAIELRNSHHNTITENIITGIIWRRGKGIQLIDSSHNIIYRNEFSKISCCVQINELINHSTHNQITQNNFLLYYYRMSGVYFYYEYHIQPGNRHNLFDQNYWNRPRILPKYALGWISLFWIPTGNYGYLVKIIYPQFDLHPASKPYDIGT